MIFLALTILFSSTIFIIFKLFDNYKINTLQAIVSNYAVATTIGLFSYEKEINLLEIHNKSWFLGALILSILFISIFNVMAITSQKNGVGVAAIAGKMSVVIPIIFGIVLYKEVLSLLQIIGIILALIAVYLTTNKGKNKLQADQYLFPVLLFLGSGVIDTILKYIQNTSVTTNEFPLFTAFIFIGAAILGSLLLLYKQQKIQLKNIFAGIILGIINYYSVFFLLKALQTKELLSSTIFSINNVTIVLFTTLLGVIFFKEKLNVKNWIGISFAIISIFLILN